LAAIRRNYFHIRLAACLLNLDSAASPRSIPCLTRRASLTYRSVACSDREWSTDYDIARRTSSTYETFDDLNLILSRLYSLRHKPLPIAIAWNRDGDAQILTIDDVLNNLGIRAATQRVLTQQSDIKSYILSRLVDSMLP